MTGSPLGTFDAVIAGQTIGFDTRLGTIAAIEERCGALPVVEIVTKAVFGRLARDRIALLAAALSVAGRSDADALAAAATMTEAEGFILALMRALGFTVAPRGSEGDGPLAGPNSGAAGASSPSAP